MSQLELEQFVPQTARYSIFYPKTYELFEDEESVVTISSNDTDSSMTLSGYEVDGEADEKVLREFLNEITSGYEVISEPEIGNFGEGLKIEAKFTKDENYWIWKIFSVESAIVVVSINSSEDLDPEQLGVYEFMLQNFEIYPD
ncbi:hypothetical protein I5M27_07935 [Adhaeribacter sp. BT258]|uniref:DUF3805 domain-containing protein n=1 Tax=Adhaeribacter terrigena TaxID=2793070 RepID=A0ABS1C0H8_9BACT|nr:hypothetical protein [Adhaeribacter terrigena]MBK0402913.1 hypothetical protein [Adhaeribacter terrigena]